MVATDPIKPNAEMDVDSFIERASGQDFDATLHRLIQTIEKAGLRIFARIDHAAAARSVGLEMPPTVVLIYGNPIGGTPLMLASPQAALDLPLKVLVREDAAGRTFVGIHPITAVLQRAGVPFDLASRLEAAQRLLFVADNP